MRSTAKLPIPLHRSILRAAAQPALRGVQARCLIEICLEFGDTMEFLNPEAQSLVDVFRDLLTDGFRKTDIVRLDSHRISEHYANYFLDELTDDALLILSLVTWHFDASLYNLSKTLLPPPSLLLHFGFSRNDEELRKILWDRYTKSSGQETSLEAFTTKFRILVYLLRKGFRCSLGLSC
ncbi:hypothetical protein BDV59DRAFT_194321 [Aspergillus ambiguus]|uniref:uncharacterized protein n=1 Tax=Aspergillus ambiguus TaxID=176160 RepID=UPI003CCDCD3D